MPADTFTGNINLRKPEVGAAYDTWGGVAGLNGDLDILDAIFLASGLSTVAPPAGNPLAGVPGVGLRIGKGMVLNVEGQAQFKDATDATKVGLFDSSLISTGTTRTLKFPDENGVIATQVDIAVRVPTGTVFNGYYGVAPPGFVMADGRTIGDATSGATNRANADTVGLFTLLWTVTTNAQCPVSGGRGASAAADYAAHKTLTLPDHSGRMMAGRDNLSGTAVNRITVAASGIAGTTLGAAGGDQNAQNHTHTITDPGHTHGMLTRSDLASTAASSAFVSSGSNLGQTTQLGFTGISGTNGFGLGGSQNMPPTIVVDVIIAL